MSLISLVFLDFMKGERLSLMLSELLRDISRSQLEDRIEVIVVDNSCSESNWSHYSSIADSPVIRLYKMDENLGYTKGCNFGARVSSGDYICFVNPDVAIPSGGLSSIIHIAKSYQNSIVGFRQINDDGSNENIVREFPDLLSQVIRRTPLSRFFNSLVGRYEKNDFDYGSASSVPWLQSSFMMLKRELFVELGEFDERYFIFMADADICLQAWKKGYTVMYLPDVVLGADGIRCSAGKGLKSIFSKIIWLHFIDAVRFYVKNGWLPQKTPFSL